MRDGFNPLSDLFVAQFAKPPDLEAVNLRALTPFQRALLVIDGTVTKFIEAYTMEPVTVRILSHDHQRLVAANSWLEAAEGTPLFARDVVLEGAYTGTLHAQALSLVVPERLPAAALRQLETDPAGLGRILLDARLETRREVLWYGREPQEALPAVIRSRMPAGCLSRTYRIITGGRPVTLICERFPLTADRFLAQV